MQLGAVEELDLRTRHRKKKAIVLLTREAGITDTSAEQPSE